MGSNFSVTAVVPTWNEAPWLATLLVALQAEPLVNEIVVADNASTDETRRLARSFGCTVIDGGLPAYGRNAGARVARSDHLLFVDADVILPPRFFQTLAAEFTDSSRTLVHCRLVPQTGGRFIRLCYRVVNAHASFCSFLRHHQGSAPVICVRREAFEAVGGFDERIRVAEDVDFIRRVGCRIGGVSYLTTLPVYVSSRRFAIENGLVYGAKSVMWALLRLFGLRTSIRDYIWTTYPAELAARDALSDSPLAWEDT